MSLRLSGLSRKKFAHTDNIKIWGSVFGMSRHVERAGERKYGNPLRALLPKEYISRSELDRMHYAKVLLAWTTVSIHGDQVSV